MKNRRLQIPSGMQDTLPGECLRKRQLEQRLREQFRLSGYQEIETPVLEYYDALDDQTYGYPLERVWKTFDSQGRLLAVRPDTTIPAVRLAAGRLRNAPLPLRLCYLQPAAQYQSETLSLLCEETQAGVELMGASSPLADAEVICLAIECLRQAGLRDFQIELGQSAFFDGFMREAGLSPEQCAALREMTAAKNTLAMQLYLDQQAVPREVTRRLMRLPRLYGDTALLTEAASLTRHPLCEAALENLRQIVDAVAEAGFGAYLSLDLGMVHAQNYYSGMIFRGMTADLGQPLLSGGRYDGLPGRFGRELPAVGFALHEKLMLMALERQGEAFPEPAPQVLIAFAPGCYREALAACREQRAAGRSAALLFDASPEELQARGDAGRAETLWIGADAGKEAAQ